MKIPEAHGGRKFQGKLRWVEYMSHSLNSFEGINIGII